jgi:hypothetical protein
MTRRVALIAIACATVSGAAVPACVGAQDAAVAPKDLPPVGFGTLGQEDISLKFRTPSFLISMLPLDERIIRLLAPDTYGSMHRLRVSRTDQVNEAARQHGIREPVVFLVSFFGTEPQARFDPEALTLTSQNRFFRPAVIVPLSPGFGDRQLNQRETATALYVYEDAIRLFDPFSVSFAGLSTDAWEGILRTVDRERASVDARAAAARRKPG